MSAKLAHICKNDTLTGHIILVILCKNVVVMVYYRQTQKFGKQPLEKSPTYEYDATARPKNLVKIL